jgi:hypothetical protein
MIYRKCDKVGKTSEHVMAWSSSLSETAYLRRETQLTKIINQESTRYSIEILHCTVDTSQNWCWHQVM